MKHGWEYKKLGEVSEIVGGSTPKTNIPSYWDGEYSWITPAELNGSKYIGSTERHITIEALAHTNLQLLPVGTVLLTSRAPIGKVAITKIPMYCNQGFKNIVPGDSLFNEFAYWYLTYKKDYIISLGRGATFKEISKSITEQIPIPVPPFEEQKAICSLLDKMNRVIEAKKEQLKELDNLAQAIFYDMFGDPVTNEKGWSVKSMKVVAPAVEYKGEHPQIDGKFWLLNLDKVEAQTGNILSVDYYEYDEIGNSVVSFDSSNVLYSKLRPYLNKVVVPTEIGFATSELVPLQPDITLLERQYLAYMLRSKQFVDFINSKVSGAKMPRVDMTVFRNFTVPIPPLPLQQAFAEKVEAIERQKELINQSLREVQTLFDSRMDYWFSEEDDDFGQLDKLD